MTICGKKCMIGSFLGIGTFFLLTGIIIVLIWGSVFYAILLSELTIAPGTKGYEIWKETPIPMYLELHLFNWTNSHEVIANWSIKPILQDCGPYVFAEKHIRVNMHYNDNGTITYQQKRVWHFDESRSEGSLDDEITNLNAVAVSLAYFVRDKNELVQFLVNVLLREKESLVTTRTAGELLFDGYDDELLKLVNTTGFNLPFDKFGWFYKRNESETYDGTWTMNTGRKDLYNLGMLTLWNGVPATDYYNGYCAYVNGTSGELWPPLVNKKNVSLFANDICSSVTLKYDQDYTVLGITGKKFIADDYVFDNGSKYPEQACFRHEEPLASGMRNVSKCKFGAPAFVSFPHFYLADESYLNAVEGLTPNKSEHEMFLAVEPTTGIPLDVKAQLQINLLVQPMKHITMLKDVKEKMYIPVLWFRQTVTLTDKFASLAKLLLSIEPGGMYTGYAMMGLGVALCLVGVALIVRVRKIDAETKQLLSSSQETLNDS